MNKIDQDYISILKDIINNGVEKQSRAGSVKSIFGRQLRADLKNGLPILTTKKVFTRGTIQELLWFIKDGKTCNGSMNIRHLVENDVHIWDYDAYRWFKEWVKKNILCSNHRFTIVKIVNNVVTQYEKYDDKENDFEWLKNLSKDEFISLVKEEVSILHSESLRDRIIYTFGDLGPIYGKQWRRWGSEGIDQLDAILDTLRTNPSDRRMLCLAYNPSDIYEMALPPCHVMMQFYTRELSDFERYKLFMASEKNNDVYARYELRYGERSGMYTEDYDNLGIPKYGLSCMWTQRSADWCLGVPINLTSYSILTYMMAKLVNMIPDEVVGSFGDCHIYLNQMDGINEQLSRNGKDTLPNLIIHGDQKTIDDFKYDDFEIVGYDSDPIIRFPLSVG